MSSSSNEVEQLRAALTETQKQFALVFLIIVISLSVQSMLPSSSSFGV